MSVVILTANTSWYLYNFRASTISALLERGYKVYCISPKDKYSSKLERELGCLWVEINIDTNGHNPFKDLLLIFHFYRLFVALKANAVFNFTVKNNIYATLAAKFASVNVYNNISGLGTAFIRGNLVSKVVNMLYKVSQPFATKVFCQNPEDMALLVENNLVDSSKLHLLPGSGVNTSRFHPSLKLTPSSPKFVFLYVGRLLGDKGLRELMSASKLLHKTNSNFILRLCGFSEANNHSVIPEAEIRDFSKEEFVEWIGPSDDMPSVYSAAQCVILPSYREGMPRTLLEAGAMGLPSITTDVPGCKHVISEGFNGFICKVRDTNSLLEALQKMLELSPESYSIMCHNSRVRIEKEYDESIVVNSVLEQLS